MSISADAYLKAAYPPPLQPPHLSDEDIALALDKSAKHSKAAHKASETRRQKRAEQQVTSEKEQSHE